MTGVLLWIMAVNRTHPDPVKDQRGCYKRGDLIDVYPSWMHGHCTGGHAGTHPATWPEQRQSEDCRTIGTWETDAADLAERPITDTTGVLIRVQGPTVNQVRRYLDPETVEELDPETGQMRPRPVRRRLFRVRVDDLPTSVRAQLVATRYYATTLAAIRTFIRNKVTGIDE